MTDMVTKEQMIERMARAMASTHGEKASEQWWHYSEEAEAALDASGLWPVYEAAQDALGDFEALISESEGVYGLHLNGDEADWASLIEGGSYEEWTSGLTTLRAALTAMEQTNG